MADWLAGDLSDDSLCGRDWLAGPRPPSTLITSHEYFNPITQHTQKFFSSSSCCQRTLLFCSLHGVIFGWKMGLTSFQGARVVFVVGGSHDLLEKGAGAARSLNTPRFLGGAGEVTHTAGYRDRPDWLNVSICETLFAPKSEYCLSLAPFSHSVLVITTQDIGERGTKGFPDALCPSTRILAKRL